MLDKAVTASTVAAIATAGGRTHHVQAPVANGGGRKERATVSCR
jgi:hypothetical protein